MRSLEDRLAHIQDWIESHHFGKYRGVVHEVGSGDRLGLIKARVPALYHDEISPWAEPCVPLAGDGYGALVLPRVDDVVWIECAGGHLDTPIWSGFSWAPNDELPEDAAPERRLLVTPEGHKVIVDDDEGLLRLVHASGAEITLADGQITIKADDSNKLVLSSSGLDVNDGAWKVS